MFAMLFQDTYNDPVTLKKIENVVGKKFSFIERIKMKGIGSQRMMIAEASPEITELLYQDQKLNHCNIELREGGLLVRFQSKMYTYAFAIPWHYLTFFRTGESLQVYGQNNHVKLRPAHNEKLDRRFILKVLQFKAIWSEDHPTLRM